LKASDTKQPDISVILPIYNVEEYLTHCINSIILNTPSLDIQIIAVNDASTDGSLQVLNQYLDKCNITIIDLPENKGAGYARNVALSKAGGIYTLFMDSDDYYLPNSLNELVDLAKIYNTDVVFFTYQIWHEKGDNTSPMFPTDRSKWNMILKGSDRKLVDIESTPSLLTVNNYPWNKLCNTEFLKSQEIAFSETIVNNDIYAHWLILMKSKDILMFDKPCYVHRLFDSREQITTYFDERRFDLFTAINHVDEFFSKNTTYKENYYHQFMVFKVDLLQWAKSKMPNNLLSRFEKETIQSMKHFTLNDFKKGILIDPKFYFKIALTKLKSRFNS